ncbi:T9SS type A sorting domain-containing protein, partial [candidate division KSB1 bacterium]|nr:T9SS type A sorting domain-containing protein [candidate division KSB1 bacterium]
DVLTWVNHSDHSFPFRFFLKQNYPNPFNPSTTIKFTVPAPAHVKLEVFNVNGQHVRTLVDETQTAGIHTVEWNGLTDTGECVSSGMYFYRLSVEGIFQERCAVLVR